MRMIVALAALAFTAPAAASIALPLAAHQEMLTPVTIYFAPGSPDLDANTRSQLDGVVETYRRAGSMQVVASAHADGTEGDATAAGNLSYDRAVTVRGYLAGQGVPEGSISIQAFGAERPAIDTKASEPLNRRVEITFDPGSGW